MTTSLQRLGKSETHFRAAERRKDEVRKRMFCQFPLINSHGSDWEINTINGIGGNILFLLRGMALRVKIESLNCLIVDVVLILIVYGLRYF